MIPVLQTIRVAPNGNCFPACIASIFEISIDDVPHFFAGSAGTDLWTQAQWDAVKAFAESRNHVATWIDPETESEFAARLEASDLYYIAFGDSITGVGHCVVMRKGEYVHDPMGRKFLTSKPWLYVLFEPSGSEGSSQEETSL